MEAIKIRKLNLKYCNKNICWRSVGKFSDWYKPNANVGNQNLSKEEPLDLHVTATFAFYLTKMIWWQHIFKKICVDRWKDEKELVQAR